MPRLSRAERDAFLTTPGVLMRIATVDAGGDAHVTPIWFIDEAGRLWFTPRAESAWLQHLRAHAGMACTIDEATLPYRKLVVEGEVSIVHDVGADGAGRDRYGRIAARYVPPRGAAAYPRDTIDQPRALCALTLAEATVRSWRMPQGVEPRSGIWRRRYDRPGSPYAAESADGRAGRGRDSDSGERRRRTGGDAVRPADQ